MKKEQPQQGFGQIVPPQDAKIFSDSMLPGQEPEKKELLMGGSGNALWSYYNEGTIYGYPVAEEDKNMPIEREEQLSAMFEPKHEAKSEIFWLSPDNEESIKRYDDILKMVSEGKAVIVEENKQYDAAKGAYLVWIRYDKVWFQLHPRFKKQLSEEANG